MIWLHLLLLASAAAAQPLVIAHRGGMAHRPENTMAAYEHALRLGVDIIEFDMGVTSDGEVVIHHDTRVNKEICHSPSSPAGPIRALSLKQILTFDCGSRRPARFPGQQLSPGARMPTLDQFLSRMAKEKVLLLGETKMDPDSSPHFVDPQYFVQRIAAAIARHQVAGRFILQSGDYRTLDAMRRLEPRVRLCLLNARRFPGRYVELAAKHHAAYLMLRLDDVSADQTRALKAAGLKLFSGTSNNPQEWPDYRARGFDGILTDAPADLISFLNK